VAELVGRGVTVELAEEPELEAEAELAVV
jgi:hypothetical protein